MPIGMQLCLEIGMFNPTHRTSFINEKPLWVVGLPSAFRFGVRFVLQFECYLHVVTLNLIRVRKKGAVNTIPQFSIGI